MIGHFPPPVHGMAVAFQSLSVAFEREADVVRLTTSPHDPRQSLAYHAVRVGRVARAILRLIRLRSRADNLVLSVDAGLGMAYVVAIVLAARALRYTIHLQHHSYAYLNRRSAFMRALARCSSGAVHICSCIEMAQRLTALYPRVRTTLVVPVSYAVRHPPSRAPRSLPAKQTDALRVGHFGNLTMAKGLRVAVETVETAVRAGIPTRLVLAGPLAGATERDFVDEAIRRLPDHVSYIGPVYGVDRDHLLEGLDVLLFPSRYSHESFGLALWECLSLGTPAIAYRAGCLTQAATGSGAVVLEPGDDFVPAAVDRLRYWHGDAAALAQTSAAARAAAEEWIRRGEGAVEALVASVARAR